MLTSLDLSRRIFARIRLNYIWVGGWLGWIHRSSGGSSSSSSSSIQYGLAACPASDTALPLRLQLSGLPTCSDC